MYVREWMSSPAITAPPEMPATTALERMKHHSIRRLPVVDGDRIVGIVTKTDLVARLGLERPGRRGAGTLLFEIMKKNPVTVVPEDTVESAARILFRKKISGLPVVEGGRVAGVITESDIFRALCRMLGVDGRGARMEVALPDDQAIVNYLSNHVAGFQIQNLVTVPDLHTGGWTLVLRIRGRKPATGVAAGQ